MFLIFSGATHFTSLRQSCSLSWCLFTRLQPTRLLLALLSSVQVWQKKDTKCHPIRVFNPCWGKKKLSFGGQLFHKNDDEPKGVPESESVADSASTSDNDSEKKKRKFLLQWLKTYGWLKYDEDKNFMYCEVCTKFSRKNSFHQNE